MSLQLVHLLSFWKIWLDIVFTMKKVWSPGMAEKELDLKNFTIDKLVKSTKRQLPQNFFFPIELRLKSPIRSKKSDWPPLLTRSTAGSPFLPRRSSVSPGGSLGRWEIWSFLKYFILLKYFQIWDLMQEGQPRAQCGGGAPGWHDGGARLPAEADPVQCPLLTVI